MIKKLLAAVLLTMLAVPSLSLAASPRMGPYVSGFVGVAIPSDTDATSGFSTINDRVEFDPGINGGATAGMDFGLVRLEGEISYKHGEIASLTDKTGFKDRHVDGSIGALAMMMNLFVDLHNPGPITPYFGGGIGFASLHQSDTFASDGSALYLDDSDAVFAYQVGAGLEIPLNRMLSLDLGYRYFKTSEATFSKGDPVFENSLKFESHNLAAGLRLKF